MTHVDFSYWEATARPTRPPLAPPYEGGEETLDRPAEQGTPGKYAVAPASRRLRQTFPPFVRGGRGGLEGSADIRDSVVGNAILLTVTRF
jgi:hypothetical protein